MSTGPRRKSPRAPSLALGEAIEKACKIYDAERCHVAPADGVAQHIGYKNAANGAALSTLATLRYFGLLERPREGMLAVSKDVEAYKFAPNQEIRQELTTKWLKSPPVFAELLETYAETLPSDATLKFDLIQKGFTPVAADSCIQVFRRSVEFASYFDLQPEPSSARRLEGNEHSVQTHESPQLASPGHQSSPPTPDGLPSQQDAVAAAVASSNDVDRIPVRLAGGRRAWIEIPVPFYLADKERLKKQIDLLLTDDLEDNDDAL